MNRSRYGMPKKRHLQQTIKDGDLVVFKAEKHVTQAACERMNEEAQHICEEIGVSVGVMVLADGIKFEVVRNVNHDRT